jgi:hypothetical protein
VAAQLAAPQGGLSSGSGSAQDSSPSLSAEAQLLQGRKDGQSKTRPALLTIIERSLVQISPGFRLPRLNSSWLLSVS